MTATAIINGIAITAPDGAIAYKYADPTEDARWVYAEDDLRAVKSEDPSLIVPIEPSATEAS